VKQLSLLSLLIFSTITFSFGQRIYKNVNDVGEVAWYGLTKLSDDSDELIVAGSVSDGANKTGNLTKLGKTGNVIWSKNFGDFALTPGLTRFFAVAASGDPSLPVSIVAVGQTNDFGKLGGDGIVVGFNDAGDVVFQRYFGVESPLFAFDYLSEVQFNPATNGWVIMGAETAGVGQRIMVITLDNMGNIIDQITIAEPIEFLDPGKIVVTRDGGYVLTGDIQEMDCHNTLNGGLVVKLDQNLQVIWSYKYALPDENLLDFFDPNLTFMDIQNAMDDRLVITGINWVEKELVRLILEANDGSLVNMFSYKLAVIEGIEGFHMSSHVAVSYDEVKDEEFYTMSLQREYVDGTNDRSFVTLKTNLDGHIIWAKDVWLDGHIDVTEIIPSNLAGTISVGYFSNKGFVDRLDANGRSNLSCNNDIELIVDSLEPCIEEGIASYPANLETENVAVLEASQILLSDKCSLYLSGTASRSSIQKEEESIELIRLYPNPARQFVTLELKDPGAVQVSLFNMQGQNIEVAPLVRKSNRIIIPTEGLVPGMYFIDIKDTKNSRIIKFIKE